VVADRIFPTTEGADDAEFYDVAIDEDFLNEEVEEPEPYGFTWRFDFASGDIFTDKYGRFIRIGTDRETLHEFVSHTLATERFETPIYGGDIGTDINHLIGRLRADDPHTISLVEREIKNAIMVHDRVAKVEKVAVIPLDSDLFVYIRIVADDETVIQEVVNF
jgi:hypothetical protein